MFVFNTILFIDCLKEFTTEIYNFRDNTESTVTDEIEDNSSAIKPKVIILFTYLILIVQLLIYNYFGLGVDFN